MSYIQSISLGAVALVLLSSLTLGGCATSPKGVVAEAKTAAVTVAPAAAQLVLGDPDLATFTQLINQAKLAEAVQAQPVTIFAPTNEAFAALSPAALDKLKSNPEQLKAVLQYHIATAKVMAADISENTSVPTLSGTKLAVSKAGDFITLDESMVVQADVNSKYGIIHKIDRVLTPPAPKK